MRLTVDTSFCCCKLQTGTKIIGWLYLVVEMIGLIGIVTSVIMFMTSDNGHSQEFPIIAIVYIVSVAMMIAATIPLFIATYQKKRPKLVLPWLICAAVSTSIAAVTVLYQLYFTIVLEVIETPLIVYFVATAVLSALKIYYWIVVYSFYRLLIETQ
ncbi:hypothetical protein DAPPUDRAFT_313845 [Daphnia pulex]|uniref:Uncharacterized protein n=1 Tax=Daphnia pulex TaxID=6669 RepID=E9G5F8_DAPPU|nr:hypothetical protein DAPPUDRAFT_313845 [Daphnia pulex]|eukprot:EFX85637.1 hypothetical protein DAPPUDRAFT_313845 [Daphnia pulex]